MKKGLLSLFTIGFVIAVTSAQNVTIPDANFKAYLVGNTAINTNADAEIQVSEANAYSGVLDCSSLNITDLTGIETFTTLTQLFCYNNQLTSLDVASNTSITRLWCHDNSITVLDVTQNPALTYFFCYNNSLLTLDLTYNSLLNTFNCSNNSLTSLSMANGSNNSIPNSNFSALGNPNLSCIEVDDATWSTTNWTNVDATVSFSEDCSSTGINDLIVATMNVYPNPAFSIITIDTKEQIQSIMIYDFNGSLMQTARSKTFSVEDLSSGIYIANVKTAAGIFRARFVKQ